MGRGAHPLVRRAGRGRRGLGALTLLALLAPVAWAGPSGAVTGHSLLGRTATELRAEGWVLHRCGATTCAGALVDGGPFGRGREVYGIWFVRGRAVVQYDLRLARGEPVGAVRHLVLAAAPPKTSLGPFTVVYAPGQDVAVAAAVSPTLGTWLGAVDPKGRFCVYLATAPTGGFVASDVRHVLVAAWVKGANYGGC